MAGAWVSILNRTGQRSGPWGAVHPCAVCVSSAVSFPNEPPLSPSSTHAVPPIWNTSPPCPTLGRTWLILISPCSYHCLPQGVCPHLRLCFPRHST